MHEPDASGALTREAILAHLRDHATFLDPANARLYRAIGPNRWMDAAELAADLLVEHWRFLYERPRRGRRAHNATVYGLLGRTNEAQLAAALALVHTVISLLLTRPEND